MVILALVLVNGVLAGAEIAIVALRRTRVQQLVSEGKRGARAIAGLRDNPERFLATVQVGITVIGAAAGAFGGQTLVARLEPYVRQVSWLAIWAEEIAFVLVVGLVSYLSLVLGELVPKSLALRKSETYALLVARPLSGVASLARPVVWFLTTSSNAVLRLFGDRTSFTEVRVSPEELQQILGEASKTGTLDPRVSAIASRAIEFGDLTAADVMVPRNQIVALEKSASPDDVLSVVTKRTHSRLPVYDGQIDNVIGYIAAKDALAKSLAPQALRLDEIVRPVPFVPDTMRAVDVLQDLQRRHAHLAIVVDERGGVSGLLTTEDLVEELVGEIFGEEEEVPAPPISRDVDGAAVVLGTTPVRDVNRELGIDLPEGELWTTIAGLFLAVAGHMPTRGERVVVDGGTELEAADVTARRVRFVRIPARHLVRKEEGAEEEEEEDAGGSE